MCESDKNYAWPVTTLCKYDYYALKKCLEQNKHLFSEKKIVIMGAGIRGTAFSILLKKFGYCNMVFTDNNEMKIGGVINEYPILSYKEIEKHIDEEVVLISVENGFSLKKQLEQSGFIENKNYFYIENNLYDLYLEEFLAKRNTQCLIMGDCGITDVSIKDDNFINLGEMLKEKLGVDKTKVLAIHAMGMRAYYHILKAQIEYIEKPSKVVIMTNFETFTGKQHLLPRSQHAKLIKMISNAIANKDSELSEYVNITQERFNNFKLDYFTSSQEVMDGLTNEKNNRIVIKMNYMYELKENIEGIEYLKKIINICEEEHIKLLFFIPPVNYMYAEELYGEGFTNKYSHNVNELRRIVHEASARNEILDMSYLLTSDKFADIHTIDETTNYIGRLSEVIELSNKIESME